MNQIVRDGAELTRLSPEQKRALRPFMRCVGADGRVHLHLVDEVTREDLIALHVAFRRCLLFSDVHGTGTVWVTPGLATRLELVRPPQAHSLRSRLAELLRHLAARLVPEVTSR